MQQMIPPASRQDILSMIVTEHFTLQGARSAAIGDANGRVSFFLGTLSAVVVALAFVAQISAIGTAFVIFALVLLPMMIFIGLATFERLIQLGIENIRCVAAINRIRHYYLEVAPELEPHFTLSPYDDTAGIMSSLGAIRSSPRPWDLVITNAGLIAVLISLVAGVTAGLVGWLLAMEIVVAALAAAGVGVAMAAVLLVYLARSWRAAQRMIGVRFPTAAGMLDLSHLPRSEHPDHPDVGDERATPEQTIGA